MITHDARRSLSRGNNPVPSPWQATEVEVDLAQELLRDTVIRVTHICRRIDGEWRLSTATRLLAHG
jgi:hypothetical protein